MTSENNNLSAYSKLPSDNEQLALIALAQASSVLGANDITRKVALVSENQVLLITRNLYDTLERLGESKLITCHEANGQNKKSLWSYSISDNGISTLENIVHIQQLRAPLMRAAISPSLDGKERVQIPAYSRILTDNAQFTLIALAKYPEPLSSKGISEHVLSLSSGQIGLTSSTSSHILKKLSALPLINASKDIGQSSAKKSSTLYSISQQGINALEEIADILERRSVLIQGVIEAWMMQGK